MPSAFGQIRSCGEPQAETDLVRLGTLGRNGPGQAGGPGPKTGRPGIKKPGKPGRSLITFHHYRPNIVGADHIPYILIRCLVRLSQIGGTDERIIFSFLSDVLSLQIISDLAADFILSPYIPAIVTIHAAAMSQPILVLISVDLIYMTKIFWKCYIKG